MDRQTDRPIDRHSDRRTDIEAKTETERGHGEINRQTYIERKRGTKGEREREFIFMTELQI